ncbi:hypothetical protein [Novosphingobium colocasiae]|nr:hypothetical protein [Novosphingobium colocasiae]
MAMPLGARPFMSAPVHSPILRALLIALVGAATLPLAACDGARDPEPGDADKDPAITGALADPIMVDPQMAGDEGAALSANSGAINIPPDLKTPEAVAAALQDAARIAGGPLAKAPPPTKGEAAGEAAITAARVAGRSGMVAANCAAGISYSNVWAAKLPADLPVFPRGAVQEAAGSDAKGCALRVVHFVTPVTTGDVMNFYYTMARRAGFTIEYRQDGADYVMAGRKAGRAWKAFARARDDGLSEVDLVTSGA